MSRITNWLGSTRALSSWRDDVDRAVDTGRTITDQSSDITIYRRGTALAEQTVRLEPLSVHAAASVGVALRTTDLAVLLTGYRSHPTVEDTDVEQGDQFVLGDQWYTVKHVVPNTPDRLLAVALASEV